MNSSMIQVYEIESGNFTKAGEAAGNIKKLLRQLGIDAGVVRRVSIAAYEAEMNMVIHSIGGIIKILIDPEAITFKARDTGPGIEDIELAMKEGYSTATDFARELGFGAGMGLPNIKKCSDDFIIKSEVGVGTRLEARFNIST
ncbi:MAG: anti-sigma regulatory factor [Clostridiales bacterium]|nr:anti-sigma regulatory factor [Clostridiales bacterium]